jgi:hypothetical protein
MLVARSANQSLGCTRGAAPASTGKNVARASYNLDVNLAEFATKIEMNIILYIYILYNNNDNNNSNNNNNLFLHRTSNFSTDQRLHCKQIHAFPFSNLIGGLQVLAS